MYLQELSFRWQSLLGVYLTIEIPNDGNGDDAIMQAKATKVLDILRSVAPASRVEIVTKEEMQDLLRPWLGASDEIAQLPFPILIRIFRTIEDKIDIDVLKSQIVEIVPEAIINDKAEWLGNALQIVTRLLLFSWFVLGLALIIMLGSVTMICKSVLAVHRRTIEIIHLMGAQDSYIAKQFQIYTFKMTIWGSILGCLSAAVALLGIAYGFIWQDQASLGSILRIIQGWHSSAWIVLAAVPVTAVLLSVLVARFAILSDLKNTH